MDFIHNNNFTNITGDLTRKNTGTISMNVPI